MAPVYEANPLDSACGEIRLLRLLPGSRNDQISLTVRIQSLQDNPSYTAASYMWGVENATRDIILDGEPFVIRENLWLFLLEFRAKNMFPDSETQGCKDTLWIDAICINQGNIEERNQQVAMMGEIYSQAEEVAVWLGLSADHSPLAMQSFSSRRTREEWNPEEGQAMLSLFHRTYWKRVWIVQEFVLAQRLTIYCGTSNVSGRDLVSVVRTTEAILKRKPLIGNPPPFAQEMWESPAADVVRRRVFWQKSSRAEKGLDFSLLLGNLMHMQASDVRDRVYALLSLGRKDELHRMLLSVDYSKSPMELYSQVLRGLRRLKGQNVDFEELAAQLQLALGFELNDPRVKHVMEEFGLGALREPDPHKDMRRIARSNALKRQMMEGFMRRSPVSQ
ncbi:heterokaryon incompatibility protein-domain-containing protein [Clohesyomyces aquaticus]|uniref:Heterokaryon incompatibility protein-domain-containing protein n=1 Tax=Clohesyomyces aquaticus TaxID=1231657 RepID=A0A1Y1Y3I4_9PLEO|nr:heterokaryon incompatibility protein-domain-containing protein [Clohesyomyces aquaticus]